MKINSYTHHFIQNTVDEHEGAILNGMWMLIVVVSGVNCRFWFHSGSSGQKAKDIRLCSNIYLEKN